jgi:shikimate 5-dehydrogenase
MKKMGFIGVSTASSSIMQVFPKWNEILELNCELFGIDVPLAATREQHRAALLKLRDTENCQGALITTHKLSAYHYGLDLFEAFDDFANLCGEVSSVKVRNKKLFGAAKDPISAGLSLEEFITEDQFRDGAEVFCFGDGGAATAIGWYLANRPAAPKKMTFVGIDNLKLNHLRKVIEANYPENQLATMLTDPAKVSKYINELPAESLVINATGMGKDRPGSPLAATAEFAKATIIWELNYRGSLEFYHHAAAQATSRNLKVIDGWRYFIHGWSQVIAEVFDLDLSHEQVEELAQVAENFR